jgi:hypothetical protein
LDGESQQAAKPGTARPGVSITVVPVFAVVMWTLALWPNRPWAFRGKFDEIRPGMSRSQVRQVMGRVGNDPSVWADRTPPYVEYVSTSNGRIHTDRWWAPPMKNYMFEGSMESQSGQFERWSQKNASILVCYDQGDQVRDFAWLDDSRSDPAWLTQLRSWLGL